MSSIKEKISYLKGVLEGGSIDKSSNEGKLLNVMVDVLEEMSIELENLSVIQNQLSDEIESIDEDLAEIEKIIFEDDGFDIDGERDNDIYIAEIECPHCSKKISFNKNSIDINTDTIKCPSCNRNIDIEWETDDDI